METIYYFYLHKVLIDSNIRDNVSERTQDNNELNPLHTQSTEDTFSFYSLVSLLTQVTFMLCSS